MLTLAGKQHSCMDDLLEFHKDNALVGREGNLYLRKPATRAPWYVGDLSRDRTEKAVLSGRSGDFLLRQSSRDKNAYVLCVNDNGRPKNYEIKKDPASNRFMFAGKEYKNIELVMRGLKATPIFGA